MKWKLFCCGSSSQQSRESASIVPLTMGSPHHRTADQASSLKSYRCRKASLFSASIEIPKDLKTPPMPSTANITELRRPSMSPNTFAPIQSQLHSSPNCPPMPRGSSSPTPARVGSFALQLRQRLKQKSLDDSTISRASVPSAFAGKAADTNDMAPLRRFATTNAPAQLSAPTHVRSRSASVAYTGMISVPPAGPTSPLSQRPQLIPNQANRTLRQNSIASPDAAIGLVRKPSIADPFAASTARQNPLL